VVRAMRRDERGAILLLVLFLMALTAPLLCAAFEGQATAIRCIHNDISARTALYVAEAGLNDAIAQLLLDPTWRAGFTAKEFPPGSGHTYTVTLADLSDNQIRITSAAVTADGFSRTVTVILSGF